MLKALKTSELSAVPPTHVDVFVEHYDELRRWALGFSEHDPTRAEDLLHDFFLHFTVSRPDLSSIENLEGYLYVIMRNLHLSQVRRATRTPLGPLSVVDYDTVNVSFWASDPRDRIRMRDELGAICQYACIRKESSKAGSVLILRFFHGYYPEEIAQIMCVTRPAVKERLRLARAEAKLYLESPDKLTIINDPNFKPIKLNVDPATGDLRKALRKSIFATVHGDHVGEKSLNKFYKSANGNAPGCGTLAHMVSCPSCLDEANMLLEIPTLASRYAEDTVGKDPGKKGGGDGGSNTSGGGEKMLARNLDSYIRRSNDLYNHEPQELSISINGHLHGSQRVASDKNEMTLVIDTAEPLGFVEIFSEQGIRLLMLNVEPPPSGDAKQTAHVTLSDGRTLDANLNFSGSFPALQIAYNDPSLAAEAIEITDPGSVATAETPRRGEDGAGLSVLPAAGAPARAPRSGVEDAGGDFDVNSKTFLLERISGIFKSFLQPARITGAFAALLIVALLIYQLAPTTVSAAELLNKSAEQETTQLANKERVLHRTLDLEEYKDGQLTSRKKIDVWHSAELGVTARRLYDEQGRLTTGDWRNASGVQTIYQKGSPAKLQPSPEKRGSSVLFEDAWQLSLSAREFTALISNPNDADLVEGVNDYTINYEPKSATSGLTRASITLSKEDLHAIEQSFTLKVGEETKEYRMTEAAYEWRPANAVAPDVFEPNVELTGTQAETRPVGSVPLEPAATNTNTNTETANANTATPATLATAALEVEVIDLLNSAGAFMGEQISVQRNSDGRLQVKALVETDKRKAELTAALGPVRNNPAVRIDIETVAEAQAREARATKGNQTANGITVDRYEATENTSPVYNDLRKKFDEAGARAFADRLIRRSQQARRHALAAKQLAGRFSQADLATLSPPERSKWLALVAGHAGRFVAEYESLAADLKTVFPDLAGGPSGSPPFKGGVAPASGDGVVVYTKQVQAAVRTLYDLSVSCDEDLRGSFAILTGPGGTAEVKTAKFWRTLGQAAATARSLQSAR